MKWPKIVLISFLAVLLLSGVALAVTYVYTALFSYQVTVETGTPGLTVTPTSYNFGTMAVGGWSGQQTMTITNVGVDTITGFYFETTAPSGLSFYVIIPPIFPLTPGQQITFPISLKADDAFPPGSYTVSGKVIGVR